MANSRCHATELKVAAGAVDAPHSNGAAVRGRLMRTIENEEWRKPAAARPSIEQKCVRNMKRSLVILLPIVVAACSPLPSDDQVKNELHRRIQSEVAIPIKLSVEDIFPGEGDFANLYVHVKFRLHSESDTTLASGCFAGLHLSPDDSTSPLEAVLLYQDTGRGPFSLTTAQLPCHR
jgi:hypothetical protein